MGHLLFWQEYVAETNTKNYENLFENQIQHSLWDPTSLSLEAIGETPKDRLAALTRLWHTRKRYK